MLARTLVVITLVLASFGTQARDNGQYAQVSPDIKRWVEGLTDEKGRGCWFDVKGVMSPLVTERLDADFDCLTTCSVGLAVSSCRAPAS